MKLMNYLWWENIYFDEVVIRYNDKVGQAYDLLNDYHSSMAASLISVWLNTVCDMFACHVSLEDGVTT